MVKTILIIGFCIVAILIAPLYLGGFSIEFNPFRIKLPYWKLTLSFILFFVSVFLYRAHLEEYYTELGKHKAYKNVIDIINRNDKENIKEKIKKHK